MNTSNDYEVLKNAKGVKTARGFLILVSIATAINWLVMALGSDLALVFSYSLPAVADAFCYGYDELSFVGPVIYVVTIGIGLLLWFLTKKHPRLLTLAALVWIFDFAAAMFSYIVIFELSPAVLLTDIVIGLAVAAIMIYGTVCAFRLRRFSKEDVAYALYGEPKQTGPIETTFTDVTDTETVDYDEDDKHETAQTEEKSDENA